MSPSSQVAHPLLRNRATVALIALLALVFTGLSVSQAHAAAAPQGSYTGTSTAYTGATVSFDIDANGNMSNFNSESHCSDGLFTHSVQWTGMPDTPIEAGVPFDIEWTYDTGDVSPYYELTGTVNADGSASGTGRAGFLPYGTCGGADFTWTATTQVDDPDPVYEPTATVSPSELTESELADSGVTITGSDFPADASVNLTVAGDAEGSQTADANGDVSFDYTSGSLGTGSHPVVLASGDLSADASFTVTADAPVYNPSISVSPSTLTVSQALENGVDITITGFPAEVQIDVGVPENSFGQLVETDTDGNAFLESFGLGGVSPGEYTVSAGYEELNAQAIVTITADDPGPGYEPEASVNPSSLAESELADSGVTISGSDFPANAAVALTVAGAAVDSGTADASGDVSFDYTSGSLGTGSHTAVLTSGDLSASASFTVTADAPAYDPEVTVSPKTITQSDVAENGISITATGFPANEEIALTVVENEAGGIVVTDDNGSVTTTGWAIGDTSPGERTVRASFGELSATDTFTVTADTPVYNPEVTVDPDTVTLSELADGGVTITGSDFPANAAVALTVAGNAADSGTANANGDMQFVFMSDSLGTGSHSAVLTSGDLSANASFTVTEDDDPDPVYDPQLTLSPQTMTLSEAEENGMEVTITGFPPNTLVGLTSVRGQFGESLMTDGDGNVYVESYPVSTVGLGAHEYVAQFYDLSASATIMITADDEEPVYDPQASVSPSTVTESELAESGVTVTGSDFPANEVVQLTVDGVDAGSQTADADGTVAIGYTSDGLAPGTYTAQLANGDLAADASFTVEADPAPVYNPEISLSTTEVTASVLADEGVGVTGTGFPANATVTLFVAGEEVLSGDSEDDGTIAFTFWATNYPPGEYTVRLEADAEGAQVETTFTLLADEEGEDPAPVTIPAVAPTPDDLDPALEGEVEVPNSAAPGDRIVLTVNGVEPGTQVGVWIFSETTYLGTRTVDGNGQVTVILPADIAEGTHTISVWTEAGLVGWDTILISSDGDAGVTDPEDGTAASGDQLAVTGGTLAVGTLAGGILLLVFGFGLVLLARTRGKVIA